MTMHAPLSPTASNSLSPFSAASAHSPGGERRRPYLAQLARAKHTSMTSSRDAPMTSPRRLLKSSSQASSADCDFLNLPGGNSLSAGAVSVVL